LITTGSRVIRLGAAIYYGGLRALGATALRRRLQDAALILCYHNVVSGEDDQRGDPELQVPRRKFERQMRWLRDHYDLVSLHDLVDRLDSGEGARSTAAITFDDGYVGFFEHAVPVLRTLGIPATVFVVAEAAGRPAGYWWDHPEVVQALTPARREQWLGDLRGDGPAILSGIQASAGVTLPRPLRPANWATIRAHIGGGIDVGGHSATHRALPTLTPEELEHEIITSRTAIHQATGAWPEFFAYPYGRWDSRVRGLVREAGYRAALTLDAGLNRAATDRWSLRRVNVPAGITEAAFEGWAAGFPSPRGH
jgi:peptidoglycan/xylan/chitin deacetylase (PgdA/CDA1 family)